MRISELVKTHRLLSDPDAPPWNVKFVGAFLLLAAVGGGVTGLYMMTRVDEAPGAAAAQTSPPGVLLSEYVGFQPSPAVVDSGPAEAALAAWKARHPDVTLVAEEPAYAPSGAVAGYTVRYYL